VNFPYILFVIEVSLARSWCEGKDDPILVDMSHYEMDVAGLSKWRFCYFGSEDGVKRTSVRYHYDS
jgi:hypothetical protein